MLMHNPPHPDEIIKELCLEPLELCITAADAHRKELHVKPLIPA